MSRILTCSCISQSLEFHTALSEYASDRATTDYFPSGTKFSRLPICSSCFFVHYSRCTLLITVRTRAKVNRKGVYLVYYYLLLIVLDYLKEERPWWAEEIL